MGFTRDGIALLVAARQLGANFDRTLMLGRQQLMCDDARIRAAYRENAVRISTTDARRLVTEGRGYSEPLLRYLGASVTDSLDMGDFEGSNVLHDLNEPLPSELHERYSVVIDGGTLEHVFNYATAIKCAAEAVQLGGHLILITPTDGHSGHGFYQLSPEVFYRALSPENGFEVQCVLLKALHWRSRWRHVPDPEQGGLRVLWRGAWPSMLYVLARRSDIRPVLARPAMQSDYVAVWETAGRPNALPQKPRLAALRSSVPLPIKEIRESLATWRMSRSRLRTIRLTDLPVTSSGVKAFS